MMNPVQKLERAIFNNRPRGAYSMVDASMLNLTLGLFEKAGIVAAALDISDLNNPIPVRFDQLARPGAGARLWPCVQDGKIYFYFDQYQMVGVIVKTMQRRFLVQKRECYTPYFLTPVAAVLNGPEYSDYESALEWVEQRYRRAEEVLPTLLDRQN